VNAAGLVRAFEITAPRFTAAARRDKLRLLDALARTRIRQPRALRALHEALCYLEAYPDDAEILARVEEDLGRFAERVRLLGPAVRALDDSGIAGAVLEYPFGLPMAAWLVGRFPDAVDIAWDQFVQPEPLQETLPLLTDPTEDDALSDEGGLGWRRWLDLAKGGRHISDLNVLVDLFDRSPLSEETRERLFESLALPIRWRTSGVGGSRTQAKLPWPEPYFRRRASRRLDGARFLREITRPLPSLRRAPPALATALVESARAAMATRLRELFAFSHANPDDVLVADPGRGLRVALIGIAPRHRLPLHGYYAFLALQNGVPVSYGAAWQLFGVLEAAFNVFESFRRGESALIVAEVLRAYRQAFGMRAVVVDPYQIGHDNPEALAAGAFYFYDRLGFHPRDAAVGRLARAEKAKIRARTGYRSTLPVLRQLARSELVLSLDGDHRAADRVVTASALAALVTDHVSRRFEGDRVAAREHASADVRRLLGATDSRRWSADERRAFDQLAMLVSLIPDLDRWPAADRRRLLLAMRAKGGPSEAGYVRRLDAHRRLYHSLRALVTAASS